MNVLHVCSPSFFFFCFLSLWVQAIDFLDKLLRYDHQERLTAREAMVSCAATPCAACDSRATIITFYQMRLRRTPLEVCLS